jgi:hypothetical protein
VAEILHLSHTTVSRAVALLELPDSVRAHIEAGRLAPSVAHVIGRLGDPDQQCDLADRAVTEGLSRAATAAIVRAARPKPAPAPDPEPECAPVNRRVFQTSYGVVTVEVDPSAGPEAVLDALKEAIARLLRERRAELEKASSPPPPPPPPSPPPVAASVPEIVRDEQVAPREGSHEAWAHRVKTVRAGGDKWLANGPSCAPSPPTESAPVVEVEAAIPEPWPRSREERGWSAALKEMSRSARQQGLRDDGIGHRDAERPHL